MNKVNKTDAFSLLEQLQSGSIRLADIATALEKKYRVNEKQIHPFVDRKQIKTEAASGWLKGLPISVKDQFLIAGKTNSFGLKKVGPPAETTASSVKNLIGAGAQVFARTNMPPYAMDFQSRNGSGQITNNPYDSARTAGGSSGGGAAAVASGMSLIDIGSDLSGSLRLPAAFCGVFSFVPTEGILSNEGMLADPRQRLASFARPGPIANSIDDLWLAFAAMKGERLMPNRLSVPDFPKLSAAIWRPNDRDPFTPQVASLFEKLDTLPLAFNTLDQNVLDRSRSTLFAQIMGYETGQLVPGFIRWLSVKTGKQSRSRSPHFIANVHRGYQQTAREYQNNLSVRRAICDEFDSQTDGVDFMILPAAPTIAFPHVSPCSERGGVRDYDHKFELENGDLGYFDALTYFSTPISLLGLPVVTIPIGKTPQGMPVGAQIVGRRHSDEMLLRFAKLLFQTIERTIG